MAYLADFYALYLAHNSNFHSETLYRDSRRLVEPEYAKNAISKNRYNVRILTSTATCMFLQLYIFLPFICSLNHAYMANYSIHFVP